MHSFKIFQAAPRFPEPCSRFSLRRNTTKFIALCRSRSLAYKEASPIAEDPFTCCILPLAHPVSRIPSQASQILGLLAAICSNCYPQNRLQCWSLCGFLAWPAMSTCRCSRSYNFLVFGYGPDIPGVLCISCSSASVKIYDQLTAFRPPRRHRSARSQ